MYQPLLSIPQPTVHSLSDLEAVTCVVCGNREIFMSPGPGDVCFSCDLGIRLLEPGTYIPEPCKAWGCILVGSEIDGPRGVERAVRARTTEELEAMRSEIPYHARLSAILLQQWGLPEAPNSWVIDVLPEIKGELARRRRPAPAIPHNGGRIARVKASIRLEGYAGRFTQLRPSGRDRLKGLCPIHREKTGSFYVYVDQQKWYCYGACHSGGDVIDLAERLQGAVL
jgi:hypothetical protein